MCKARRNKYEGTYPAGATDKAELSIVTGKIKEPSSSEYPREYDVEFPTIVSQTGVSAEVSFRCLNLFEYHC